MKSDSFALYLVTDPVLKAPSGDIVDIVRRACAAGVSVVQYRDKDASPAQFIRTGAAVRDAARGYGVLFIVNDRLDAARELCADGVHVGQDDVDVRSAREYLGESAIVGVSVSNVEQALAASRDGATYVAVNGVFPTATKLFPGDRFLGLEMVAAVSDAVDIPVVGIGGINESNAADVMRAGAAGVAVVTAITMRPDVEEAVRELRRRIDPFLR